METDHRISNTENHFVQPAHFCHGFLGLFGHLLRLFRLGAKGAILSDSMQVHMVGPNIPFCLDVCVLKTKTSGVKHEPLMTTWCNNQP